MQHTARGFLHIDGDIRMLTGTVTLRADAGGAVVAAQLSVAGFEKVRQAGAPRAVLPILGGTLTGCCAVAYPEVLYQVRALPAGSMWPHQRLPSSKRSRELPGNVTVARTLFRSCFPLFVCVCRVHINSRLFPLSPLSSKQFSKVSSQTRWTSEKSEK